MRIIPTSISSLFWGGQKASPVDDVAQEVEISIGTFDSFDGDTVGRGEAVRVDSTELRNPNQAPDKVEKIRVVTVNEDDESEYTTDDDSVGDIVTVYSDNELDDVGVAKEVSNESDGKGVGDALFQIYDLMGDVNRQKYSQLTDAYQQDFWNTILDNVEGEDNAPIKEVVFGSLDSNANKAFQAMAVNAISGLLDLYLKDIKS